MRLGSHQILLIAACALAFAVGLPGQAAADPGGGGGLSANQRSVLRGIAADTWRFYGADVDPNTHLPLDNLGPGETRGTYTSAANIGVYLWAVIAAHDLELITRQRADSLVAATLNEVAALKRFDGLLYQWYDTNNGNVLLNPGQGDCTETTPARDNCWFVSAVDNGWYASGLIEVRQALPELAGLANRLLSPMDFSIFYDGCRHDRPHDRQERLDDRFDRQRVRPHPLPAKREDVPREAVRVPPGVLDGEPAREHVVRTHLHVAMSDEIGHFENCLQIDANGNCTVPGGQDASGWTRTTSDVSRVLTRRS